MTDEQRATLLSLADRCEAGDGACQKIEEEIARAIGWRFVRDGYPIGSFWYNLDNRAACVPAFITSIDAAKTLVPSGMPWGLNYPANDDGQRSCHGIRTKPSADVGGCYGRAATPARALTAAALRAIAGA